MHLPTLTVNWRRFVPELNFLTLHYAYIISMVMLTSVLMMPGNKQGYIDILVFASGSCTQAGLNTVDVQRLNLWQQVVLFIVPLLTNTIFIHTAVVVIRLIVFQKKFKDIVRNRLMFQKSKSIMVPDDGRNREKGLNGRKIHVILSSATPMHSDRFSSLKLAHSRDSQPDLHGYQWQSPHDTQDLQNEQRSSFGFDDDPEIDGGRKHIWHDQEDDDDAKALVGDSKVDHQNQDIKLASLHHSEHKDVSGLNRDIRFGDLPAPERGLVDYHLDDGDDRVITPGRKIFKSNTENLTTTNRNGDIGRRFLTQESNLSHDRHVPRDRRAISTSMRKASTVENFIPSTFRKRRNSATASVKSVGSKTTMPYISFQPSVGRNSTFYNLTSEQRDELGGIEYRSLRMLLCVLAAYYCGFFLLSIASLVPWINTSGKFRPLVKAQAINPTWWGIFTTNSAFNNVGFTLTSDSMQSFREAVFPLFVLSVLIVAGNTGFPCVLRLTIWILHKLLPKNSSQREPLAFLLDHPRRCFTLMFPSSSTWWLFFILVLFNFIDVFFFLILDLSGDYVSSIPWKYRVPDAIFQSISTRIAGFSVFNLRELHPAVLVSYLVMMYISVFPVAISMRTTNVFEEHSLGIYTDDHTENSAQESWFISTHIRRQLSYDLWYVFLGLFLICIVEGNRISDVGNYWFNVFNILFEIVSAYGNVGLSIGFPGTDTSFVGQCTTTTKLIIIALEIRGRHRGLPNKLDRAVMRPSLDHRLKKPKKWLSAHPIESSGPAEDTEHLC